MTRTNNTLDRRTTRALEDYCLKNREKIEMADMGPTEVAEDFSKIIGSVVTPYNAKSTFKAMAIVYGINAPTSKAAALSGVNVMALAMVLAELLMELGKPLPPCLQRYGKAAQSSAPERAANRAMPLYANGRA